MKYKCEIAKSLTKNVAKFSEFANGATQATIKLKNGKIYEEALISGSRAIVAIRGYESPPFESNEIIEIYQTEKDISPKNRSDWNYWDKW